jgi:hypothetical protein
MYVLGTVQDHASVRSRTLRLVCASVQMPVIVLEKMHEMIDHSREEPTVIATPIPNGVSTQCAAPDQDAAEADERCLMAELSIVRGGYCYYYDGYRYDRLSEAVAYAQLVQGRPRRSGSAAAS